MEEYFLIAKCDSILVCIEIEIFISQVPRNADNIFLAEFLFFQYISQKLRLTLKISYLKI